jgi:RNA polymerase sigma-70 factor (ECF subfamily)
VEDVAALYRRYAPRLGRYFLAMTGDAARAEDLTQETFLRALRGIGGFRGESSPYTWLYAIAARVLQESIRRERRRSPLPSPAGETPEERVLARDRAARLYRALEGLEERARQVVVLRTWSELSFARIGVELGIREATARVIYHRAKLALAKALEEGER